jgi:hypothetical protein
LLAFSLNAGTKRMPPARPPTIKPAVPNQIPINGFIKNNTPAIPNLTMAIALMSSANFRRRFASKFEKLKLRKKLHLSFLPPYMGGVSTKNPLPQSRTRA